MLRAFFEHEFRVFGDMDTLVRLGYGRQGDSMNILREAIGGTGEEIAEVIEGLP